MYGAPARIMVLVQASTFHFSMQQYTFTCTARSSITPELVSLTIDFAFARSGQSGVSCDGEEFSRHMHLLARKVKLPALTNAMSVPHSSCRLPIGVVRCKLPAFILAYMCTARYAMQITPPRWKFGASPRCDIRLSVLDYDLSVELLVFVKDFGDGRSTTGGPSMVLPKPAKINHEMVTTQIRHCMVAQEPT
jgi:hypothetical protein